MATAAQAPLGGISAQLGTKSYPLILGNGEIERFEEHHAPLGIFKVMRQLISDEAQVRHVRDLVALGLIGAGMKDAKADALVQDLPPHLNMALREVARDLTLAAFIDPDVQKKSEAGSAESQGLTDTTAPEKSETPLQPD